MPEVLTEALVHDVLDGSLSFYYIAEVRLKPESLHTILILGVNVEVLAVLSDVEVTLIGLKIVLQLFAVFLVLLFISGLVLVVEHTEALVVNGIDGHSSEFLLFRYRINYRLRFRLKQISVRQPVSALKGNYSRPRECMSVLVTPTSLRVEGFVRELIVDFLAVNLLAKDIVAERGPLRVNLVVFLLSVQFSDFTVRSFKSCKLCICVLLNAEAANSWSFREACPQIVTVLVF